MKSDEHNIGMISLGCPKATVDSEKILTQLRAEGYNLVNNYSDAELVIVNTCGFIDSAIDESLQAIGEAMDENGRVIVTGCLGAKGDIVQQQYPNVLAVTGPHAYDEVVQAVHDHIPRPHDPFQDLIPAQGIKLTPPHYAYLKISEGCNHRCRFCIIPALRGDLVSRPMSNVLEEAERLVESGVKELLVISQDTSAYGVDVKYKPDFYKGQPVKTNLYGLAAALSQFDVWVRMHYVYPYPHVDDIIPLMAEGKLLPYLDIPLQHASPAVLKSMRRPANAENTLKRIEKWRETCPDITIRSTFITGFPGETEADFELLLEFLEQAKLDRVGCFTYSAVEGASTNELPNPVPESIKYARMEELMQLQQNISQQKLAQKIGSIETVLVDEVSDEAVIARSRADAPDVDGQVIIQDAENLLPGQFVDVKITDTDEHDMYAIRIK